jgi:hypothetical protein
MGVLNLEKRYDPSDIEKVCRRAIDFNHISYKFLENSLKNNTHKMEDEKPIDMKLPFHENIRGKEHYK